MIQRLQSVCLFASGIIILLLFVFPIAAYYGDLHVIQFSLLGIKSLAPSVPGEEAIFHPLITMPLIVFVGLISILSISIIFLFRNRKRQLRLIKISILLTIILIVGIFIIYSRIITSQLTVGETFNAGAFFPLISLLLLVLAYRGVKRDDKLVRSADRLR